MALNMKTYKGFNKLPYCEAHIPKAKATAIADTPELKRIAENTKIQSNVKYHEEFEKQKGKVTQVADDPETLRIKQNTKIISNVAYHGELEKKAAMEKQRGTAEVVEARVNNSTNPRRVGSIADIDPANGVYGSITEPNNQNQYYQQQNQIRQGHQHSHIHQTQQQQQQQPQQNHQSKANMRVYRALYDYQAQDMDEVSFKEGDLIFEIDPIDAGWMTGKVERTGKTGMLPANYLQPAMI